MIFEDVNKSDKKDNNYVFCSFVKGGDAKTRPPETLTNADFKILYSKKNLF